MIKGVPVNDLVRIAAAGGGLDLRAGGIAVNDLVRIAAAASNGRGQIIISPAGIAANDLVRIGAAGKGTVLFQAP